MAPAARSRSLRGVYSFVRVPLADAQQWVQLPEKPGNWPGVRNRLRMRSADGTWGRGFTALLAQADANEEPTWAVSVDSTIVRAQQHAAGARKRGSRLASVTATIGRSRGGLTTKVHLAADGSRQPLAFHLTAAQAGDAPGFADKSGRRCRRGGHAVDRPACGSGWGGISAQHEGRALRRRAAGAVVLAILRSGTRLLELS